MVLPLYSDASALRANRPSQGNSIPLAAPASGEMGWPITFPHGFTIAFFTRIWPKNGTWVVK
jgi:hypothetical protein